MPKRNLYAIFIKPDRRQPKRAMRIQEMMMLERRLGWLPKNKKIINGKTYYPKDTYLRKSEADKVARRHRASSADIQVSEKVT